MIISNPPLHSQRIEDDVFCLMTGLAGVALNSLWIDGFGSFDLPLFAMNDHVGRSGSVFLAVADELHGHARHGEHLGGFVLVGPDVKVWRDDGLSPGCFM